MESAFITTMMINSIWPRAALLTGICGACYYVMRPRYVLQMKKDGSTVDVYLKHCHGFTYIDHYDAKIKTEGLECLCEEKGYTVRTSGPTRLRIYLGDRSAEQFLDDCRICNIQTHVAFRYELILLEGKSFTKSQTLDWGDSSITELK